MRERRKIAALPKFEFLLEITGEIVMSRELNGRTERRVGLNKNFTSGFAAPGATRDLSQQLERPFARPKIGHVQRQIGVDDSDQRDIRKMQSFRDHLRADEDVDLAGPERVQRFAIGILARHGIGIHPADDGRWKKLRDVGLHFFRPEPDEDQGVLRTGRTFLWHRGGVAT